jgi:restriction system protein
MNMMPIFEQLFIAYWWLPALLFLIAFLKSPFMKGILGEFQVNLAAKFFLDKQEYRLFKNVTLPTEDGTTQIDHVIVSRYGIFVIETKNMKGWIFGDQNQKTWTQKIYRHTTKFQNPLHQNYKHTQTLQSALGLEPEKMFSLVVFVGDSEFKTPMPDNVVYAGGYIRFIKRKIQTVLTKTEVLEICNQIESGRLKPSFKTHREHVQHVKTIIENKNSKVDKNACPKCGKPMILRTTKQGANQGKQFWGCTGFPECRTMRQIT